MNIITIKVINEKGRRLNLTVNMEFHFGHFQ